ncbi:hypothetical protein GKR75_07995 [Providencia sp. wls1919]|nr:hypothetical protein [Providencia sp. wls1919]
MNSTLKVKNTKQIQTEWKKRKELLIGRLIEKREQITKFKKAPTCKKEVTKLKNAIISFAKTKAELDTHHWWVNKRTDQRILSIWKRLRNHILDSLDNSDRTLCIELERQYQNHVYFLNHQ